MLPTQFDRYKIQKQLGKGGMATVYKALDPLFEREVALKTLPNQFLDDPQFLGRFKREAKTIANLEHPAIVPVYDYGETDGQPYLVMRYMPGGSVAHLLRNGPISLERSLDVVARIAGVLDRAHQDGIVHRDLKPDNILLDEEGNAYLSDFGIAKLLSSHQTLTGNNIIGTPAYMSPEQAQGGGDIDSSADIYAFGALLYHMLAGQPPYQADGWALVMKHIQDPVPRLSVVRPDLPPGCEAVIMKAMAKRREERFATAGQLAEAFRLAILSDENFSLDDLAQRPYQPVPTQKIYQPAGAEVPTGISGFTAAFSTTTQRVKQQFNRLPWWVRGGIISLALVFLFLSLYQALAKTPDVAESASRGGQGENTVFPTATMTETMAIDVVAVLEWGGDALWQVDEKFNLVPDDGIIPITTTQQRYIFHSNADMMTLRLSDETIFRLDENSTIELINDAGVTAVTLRQGRVVVEPTGQTASISSPAHHQAQITDGLMGVEYLDGSSEFGVDCLQGNCQLISEQGNSINLVAGEYVLVDGNGHVTAPDSKETPTAKTSPTNTVEPTVSPVSIYPSVRAVLHDTWTRPADNMVMVFVPGGAFMMGSSASDPDAYEIEQPQHEVRLDGFWIDKTEVTNAQYTLCVEAGICESPANSEDFNNGNNYPVVNVSWQNAADYCSWVHGQLPTEAQWEYAARGGDGRIYPWGNNFDGTKLNYCDATCLLDWQDVMQSDGHEEVSPVASYSPSGNSWVGAADMAGNVWEWTADWYATHYYETLTSPIANPTGPASSKWKVLRGGSWRSTQRYMRSANRINGEPEARANDVGFRCIIPVQN